MYENKYFILLYYFYTKIDNPEIFRDKHHLFCIENRLKGRIIVALEGINGTISGLKNDCENYINYLKSDQRFKNIEFKIEEHHKHAFQKLNVRLKPEIVNSGLKNLNPNESDSKYIEPNEFKRIKGAEDIIILDVRSNYEHKQGTFKNSITLDMDHFREFPNKIKELSNLKNKKIVTVCTGGIKCEKASAYLTNQGFENVYKLHGGIIRYKNETDGEDFNGECYVFDNRISTPVNKVNPTIKNTCFVCKSPCNRMVNCANPKCNLHTPICKLCLEKLEGACSLECKKNPNKRPYNILGYYPKTQNGYNPYKGFKRSKNHK